ncbi:gb [Venturia nashicola]|uniref:Gb n=1 Tax=Venturia nashicola TaxID=86259 RepID=A0A4Z1PEI9_9PEZI|nr:gb [Venturia nashicola]TLD36237.1 gb [Venturia nashicola]
MPPLIINVDGTSTISRRAERAVVSIQVSSSGPDQQQVASEVTAVAKTLQTMLRELSTLGVPSGSAAADSAKAITHWSMNTLSTGSYMIYHDSDRKNHDSERQKSRQYNAHISFETKFADFTLLGRVCTDLAKMRFVSVRNIDWRLTDKTKASLVAMSRKLAVDDAISKANDFASAVGKATVTAVEINTDSNGYGRSAGMFGATRAYAAAGAAEREDALNFEPEDVDLSCSIQVKFEAE